jgi:hypothetical protein
MSATKDKRTVMFLVDDVAQGGEPIHFTRLDEATTFAGVMARRGSTATISVVSLDRHGAAFGPVLPLSTHRPMMDPGVVTGTIN